MFKRIIGLLSLFLATSALADKNTIGHTYISITNNTSKPIHIQSTLTASDTNFRQGKDWDAISPTLAPYETKQILWFGRNQHVKAGVDYRFNIIANRTDQSDENIQVTLDLKGKKISSDLSATLTL